MTAAVVELVSK